MEKMFSGSSVYYGKDFNSNRAEYKAMAKNIIYTGTIDSYFDYRYGALEYRSLYFETKEMEQENYQGVAVVNYTDAETPYTRVIEHKHFEFGMQENTVISYEYPRAWDSSCEPYYPVNDDKNNEKYEQYRELAKKEQQVVFGGRLGEYRYYDMQDTIQSALRMAKEII